MHKEKYELCPFCNHSEWHKTFGCDDVCCPGCPGDDGYCDCQMTVLNIKKENLRLAAEIANSGFY